MDFSRSIKGITVSGSYISLCAITCLVTQSCLTLCEPIDCSLPGSSDHGIFQARIWNVLPFPPTPEDLPDPGNGYASPVSHCRQILYQLRHWGSPNIILMKHIS